MSATADTAMLFVYPPSSPYLGGAFHPSLGSGYIIAYLRQQGVSAAALTTGEPASVREVVQAILHRRPRVVGFTVYDTNYGQCRIIASLIRQADPRIRLLFGGPTASIQSVAVLKHSPWVDACVLHEAEETTRELLSALDDVGYDWTRVALDRIPGITYRAGTEILRNPHRAVFWRHREDQDYLDTYPSPYLSGVIASPEPGVISARGCNQHCTFCNCALLAHRRFTTHSIARVVEELEYVSHLPRKEPVSIQDDAFTLIPGRALEICRQIVAHKIRLSWQCITRCDLVTEELLEAMNAAGMQSIAFSLESASPRVLRLLGKVQAPATLDDPRFARERRFIEQFHDSVRLAKKVGIKNVSASIIVGSPGETLEEANLTIRTLCALSHHLASYAHNLFVAHPGTLAFRQCRRNGLAVRRQRDGVSYTTTHSFDVNRVGVAPRASCLAENRQTHQITLNCLSLATVTPPSPARIDRAVFRADRLREHHIAWLRDCLAVNGLVVLVYSGLAQARRFHVGNLEQLWAHHSPALFPVAYCQRRERDGRHRLHPYRTYRYDARSRVSIHLVPVGQWLSEPHTRPDARQCLCLEGEGEDACSLHQYLVQCARGDRGEAGIWNRAVPPYFATLCRWRSGPANCHKLDTVFIDEHDQITPCWNGHGIGRVGEAPTEIHARLRALQEETAKRRGCSGCPKASSCARCLFSDPLGDADYCALQRSADVQQSADLVRALNALKENAV